MIKNINWYELFECDKSPLTTFTLEIRDFKHLQRRNGGSE